MGTCTFERPTGAKCDVKELEFVLALMQTDALGPYRDGRQQQVSSADIAYYLKSRFGVEVSRGTVQDLIVRDLAGRTTTTTTTTTTTEKQKEDDPSDEQGGGDDDQAGGGGMDLCQLVSILLIPQMLEAAQDKKRANRLFRTVFDDFRLLAAQGNPGDRGRLNRKTLRSLFVRLLDECHDISDDLLDDMIDVAGNDQSLVRAMVGDLDAYNLAWENETTSYLDDAMGLTDLDIAARRSNSNTQRDDTTSKEWDAATQSLALIGSKSGSQHSGSIRSTTKNNNSSNENNNDKGKVNGGRAAQDDDKEMSNHTEDEEEVFLDEETGGGKAPPEQHPQQQSHGGSSMIRRVYTAPGIDYVAGTYRRPLFVMVLWVCGVVTYFSYVWTVGGEGHWAYVNCDKFSSNISCEIVNGITLWLAVLVQLSTLGLAFILFSSMGQNIYIRNRGKAFVTLLVGMVCTFVVTVLAFAVPVKTKWFNTSNSVNTNYVTYVNVTNTTSNSTSDASGTVITNDTLFGVSYWISLVLGLILLTFQLVDVIFLCIPADWLNNNNGGYGGGLFSKLITPGTFQTHAKMKQAASFKVNRMVERALALHGAGGRDDSSISALLNNHQVDKRARQSSHVRALTMFQMDRASDATISDGGDDSSSSSSSQRPPQLESVGGVFWAWGKIWNGTIYSQEGIWLHSRLLACNFAQIMITVFIFYFAGMAFSWINAGESTFDESANDAATIKQDVQLMNATATMAQDLIHHHHDGALRRYVRRRWLQDTTGMVDDPASSLFADNDDGLVTTLNDTVNLAEDVLLGGSSSSANAGNATGADEEDIDWSLLIPIVGELLGITKAKFDVAVTLGILGGLAASLYVSMVYIPSYISTVLKFRSGVIPSLQDRNFLKYRTSYDAVTGLFGSCFWGCFVTSCASGGLFFLIGLVSVIHWGGGLFAKIAGFVIGFAVVMTIKTIVLIFLRSSLTKAFYRKSPAAFNVWMIVMEVWHVGLSVGFIMIRTVKLLVISLFFVARVDTPVLAPGVGTIGPAELDSYPQAFRKDLLAQEAHHHAYIERFGCLCLLKLRLGDNFGRRPHACWRLLFTVILMPWLRKYRSHPELSREQVQTVLADLASNKDYYGRHHHHHGGKRGTAGSSSSSRAEDKLHHENGVLRERLQRLLNENKGLKNELQQMTDQFADMEKNNDRIMEQNILLQTERKRGPPAVVAGHPLPEPATLSAGVMTLWP